MESSASVSNEEYDVDKFDTPCWAYRSAIEALEFVWCDGTHWTVTLGRKEGEYWFFIDGRDVWMDNPFWLGDLLTEMSVGDWRFWPGSGDSGVDELTRHGGRQ